MWPTPFDWKAWMSWKMPLKISSHAKTTTTPHEDAKGRAIARKPRIIRRTAHSVERPEVTLGTAACAMAGPPCGAEWGLLAVPSGTVPKALQGRWAERTVIWNRGDCNCV